MVSTRIFLLSDTHDGRSSRQYSTTKAFRPPFPKADVVLHSGDLTMTGQMIEHEKGLEMLEAMDAELKLVIAGNHDLSLHEHYYRTNSHGRYLIQRFSKNGTWDSDAPQQARELWTGARARSANIYYLDEGMHNFKLSNGASLSIYASPWQPEFGDWAFNYPHDEDRWNPPEISEAESAPPERDPHPIPMDAEVDIVMTHGPAYQHLDLCSSGDEPGCPHLLHALNRVRPRIHCCGHIHEAWGAERVAWNVGGPRSLGERTTTLAGKILDDNDRDVVGWALKSGEQDVISKRAAHFDLTSSSGSPLRHKEETLFINSSIVNLEYMAGNAAFLVDIDLPKSRS